MPIFQIQKLRLRDEVDTRVLLATEQRASGCTQPARLLQGLRGQQTDRGFLFSEDSSEDRRPGAGVSKEVSEKSLAQQPPTFYNRDTRGGGGRMESTPLKTAGACVTAKSSPKAPPGVQRGGRLPQNGPSCHEELAVCQALGLATPRAPFAPGSHAVIVPIF